MAESQCSKYDLISKNVVENLPEINKLLANSKFESKLASDELVQEISNLSKDVLVHSNKPGERISIAEIDSLFAQLRSNQKPSARPSTAPKFCDGLRSFSNPNIAIKPATSFSSIASLTEQTVLSSFDIDNTLKVIETNTLKLKNINNRCLYDVENCSTRLDQDKFNNAVKKIYDLFNTIKDMQVFTNLEEKNKKISIDTELNDLLSQLNEAIKNILNIENEKNTATNIEFISDPSCPLTQCMNGVTEYLKAKHHK